jgi:hypothetical protein
MQERSAAPAELFQAFGERYHEQLLEEQHIFPIVRKAGGVAAALVETLLSQHGRRREIPPISWTARSRGALEREMPSPKANALTAVCQMYEPHAAREDTIIFPAFKKAVGAKGYSELGDEFEDIEKREFAGDGFDIAVHKVADPERRLGTADLASFTAPAVGGGSRTS